MSSEGRSTKDVHRVTRSLRGFEQVLACGLYPLAIGAVGTGAWWSVTHGVNKTVIALGGFVLFLALGVFLEWWIPFRRVDQGKPGLWKELANSAINIVMGTRIWSPLFALGVVFVTSRTVGRIGLLPAEWLGPLWAQAIGAYLVIDFMRFFVHFLQHHIPQLWEWHKVHHGVENVRIANAEFAHPIDYALRDQLTLAVPVLIGFSADALLVALPMVQLLGLATHFNCRLRFGILNQIFATSRIHRWHHALDMHDGGNANFGTGLTLWDRLFGTFHCPPDRLGPAKMGVEVGPPRSLLESLGKPYGQTESTGGE